jgi:hypothetical protein
MWLVLKSGIVPHDYDFRRELFGHCDGLRVECPVARRSEDYGFWCSLPLLIVEGMGSRECNSYRRRATPDISSQIR